MILKRTKIIISSVFLLFLINGCTTRTDDSSLNSQNSVSTETTVNYSEVIQKYDGYDLDGYKYYIMNAQKKHEDFLNTLETDFDVTIKKNFENYRLKINDKAKINLIPFRFQHDLTQETLTTNYFLVNNSNETITNINFKGFPRFKNIETEAETEISYSTEDFLNLPPKGVVSFAITMSAPKEYQSKLKENKVADLSFDITDLEINGEKVDNNNEN